MWWGEEKMTEFMLEQKERLTERFLDESFASADNCDSPPVGLPKR